MCSFRWRGEQEKDSVAGERKYGGFSVLKQLEKISILSECLANFTSRKVGGVDYKYDGCNLIFSIFRRLVNLNGNEHSINDTNFEHCHIGLMANTLNNCSI
jgi:hypothetical protein